MKNHARQIQVTLASMRFHPILYMSLICCLLGPINHRLAWINSLINFTINQVLFISNIWDGEIDQSLRQLAMADCTKAAFN